MKRPGIRTIWLAFDKDGYWVGEGATRKDAVLTTEDRGVESGRFQYVAFDRRKR